MLVALPALVAFVWWSGRTTAPAATADVRIDAQKVTAVRDDVVTRVTAAGAMKTAESAALGGDGSVHLQFRIPVARIEEALTSLRAVDGMVIDQKVDVDDVVRDADSVSQGLDGIDQCLSSLADEVGQARTSRRVEQCREAVGVTAERLRTAPAVGSDAKLTVDINKPSTTSPALLLAVAAMTLVLGALIVTTLRSRPNRTVIDVTDRVRDATLTELYQRRN